MSDQFLGSISMFGFNYAPQGYALCNGDVLPISSNTALYSLLGTSYGGNGQSTFALPDFRGRSPIHQGQGPGLAPYATGQNGGTETVTLTIDQMPAHTHVATGALNASQAKGSTQLPDVGSLLARGVDKGSAGAVPAIYVPSGTTGTQVALGGLTVTNALTGNSQPFSNRDPYLTVNFCIALQGIYPSRQ